MAYAHEYQYLLEPAGTSVEVWNDLGHSCSSALVYYDLWNLRLFCSLFSQSWRAD